ncbi:MAG: hypothetical protein IJO60_01895 [Agathobacter sp.]|nr:hypothetical protein [Agathobacter sp.]
MKLEDILSLVEKYPEFKRCYQDILEFRRNPEELINMFSEALIEMDKNTVKYIIEEQQKELEEQQKELEEQQTEINDLKTVIEEKDAYILELERKLALQNK